jgi:hypothetical protein
MIADYKFPSSGGLAKILKEFLTGWLPMSFKQYHSLSPDKNGYPAGRVGKASD